MNFVHPTFLWALLALLIPLAIHLFNFRRIKRVYFSNVKLLREVKTETNSFRRLKHLLILISRMAFVVFLVLTFAQPFLPSENQKSIKNLGGLVSVYLDNSYSMQGEIGNDKYLDLAARYTSELLGVFPKDARFQLITNRFDNIEQYPVAANKIEDRLTETQFSSEYRDLATVYKRQLSLLNRYSGNERNQVFWFTDFQKSTAGDINKLELDTLNQYYIVPIKSEKNPNLMVDSVWLANPFIKSLESNQINVRIKSYSEESYTDLMLKLFIDEQQVSTATLNLAPKESVVANFNFTVQGVGTKPCKISFEDFPVTFDNEYFFILNASPKINILHLFEKPQHKFIENVYSNESVFEVNSFNVNNLDYKRIESAELIILDEIESIEGELNKQLREFVKNGGSLVLFPSVQSQNSVQGFLTSVGVGGARFVKPDSLGVGKANELALLDISNPFFIGMFEKVPSNMNMPFGNAVLNWSNAGENLLSFKNQRPFLSRFTGQGGKIYVCASPLQTRYSNFAKHALFVPMMFQIAAQSKKQGERLAYSFQENNIRVRLEKPSSNQVYKLVKGDLEIVPDQRIIGDELVFELPSQTLEAGYYKLMLDKQVITTLAFNFGKEESAMDFYSHAEIAKAFEGKKNVQVFNFTESKNFIQDFKEKNIQINLWKYMLMLALGFLLVEIALIRLL